MVSVRTMASDVEYPSPSRLKLGCEPWKTETFNTKYLYISPGPDEAK